MMLVIKEVKDEKQKMAVVAEVLKDLPEWFGIPESTQAYIEGAKDLRVWVAYQESDVVGFISLSYSSEDCAEIDCLGVKKTFQGQGIGRELITTIEREAVKQVDYLQVKTVAEGSNKDYDRTNEHPPRSTRGNQATEQRTQGEYFRFAATNRVAKRSRE